MSHIPPRVLPPKVYKVRAHTIRFHLLLFTIGGGGQTLVPAIKGCVGVAREVQFKNFLNVSSHLVIFALNTNSHIPKVFTKYWGCAVRPCKANAVKIIPPVGERSWPFRRGTFMLYKVRSCVLCYLERMRLSDGPGVKPSNSRLNRQELERYAGLLGQPHRTDLLQKASQCIIQHVWLGSTYLCV